MNSLKVRFDKYLLIAVIVFIATQGVLVSQFLFSGDSEVGQQDGTLAAQVYWGLVSLLQIAAALIFFRRYQKTKAERSLNERKAVRGLFFAATILVAVCLLSSLWSINPSVTLRRTFSLAANVFFGATTVAVLGPRRIAFVVSLACALPVFVSIVAYGLNFDWAKMENAYRGAARGVYVQKNVLGMYSWLALTCAFHAYRERYLRRALILLMACAAVAAVLASQSMTSVLAGAVSLAIYVALVFSSKRSLAARGVLAALILFAITMVVIVRPQGGDMITTLTGRDATLTGRSEIWTYVMDAIRDRPMLGYGYGAFWATGGAAAHYVSDPFGFYVAHAHNGLLDTMLDLGLLGGAPISAAILAAVLVAMKGMLVRKRYDELDALWSSLFFGLLLTSFSEPMYLVHNSFTTVLFWLCLWAVLFRPYKGGRRA